MSYLVNTLNQLDDPDMLEEFEIFELRCVEIDDEDHLSTGEDGSTIALFGIDRTATLLHSFDGDLEPLPEIIEALLSEGADIIWKEAEDETPIDTLEQFLDWLENTENTPIHQDMIDVITDAI